MLNIHMSIETHVRTNWWETITVCSHRKNMPYSCICLPPNQRPLNQQPLCQLHMSMYSDRITAVIILITRHLFEGIHKRDEAIVELKLEKPVFA